MILVIGRDGLVAGRLLEALREAKAPLLATSRRSDAAAAERLDLAQNAATWPIPKGAHTAFICAGVTRLVPCEQDPKGTRQVNVDGPVTLAKRLVDAGVFTVYLSTDRVFDGSKPRRRAEEPVCPNTEYGRQKAETERAVLALGSKAAVLRLAKILAPDLELIAGWVQALRARKPITPFRNMNMAPMHARRLADVLVGMGRKRLSGITQVSGARDVTYEWAALRLAAQLGAGPALVQAVDSPAPAVLRPAHTTFDASRARAELGFTPPEPEQVIDSLVQ